MKKKVVHLTSVHARDDIRILLKECSSLAKAGYDVSLVVADGLGNEERNGVKIYDVGKVKGRINRILNTTKNIYKKALELNADLYHFHDPELIPVGVKLKKSKKKVIFDSHEDVEKDILSKEWIPFYIRKTISFVYRKYEKFACKKFDSIVTSTPYIRDKFLSINKKSIDIKNYPILGELSNDRLWTERKDEVCYIGSITKVRGIKELVKAIEITSAVMLNLAGTFSEKNLEDEVKTYNGWKNVNELGFIGRKEVSDIMSQSKAGIVTLHPTQAHLESLPIKIFEYMMAGLPLISSDIKLWKDIIEKNNCGICVDPFNPIEIAQAIEYIITHPAEAEQMGLNGKKAVETIYNWNPEEAKLINLYKELLDEK